MIDYEASVKLNNTTVEELKAWFKKYPKSNKKIIRVCDNCGVEKKLKFQDYTDLCLKCSRKTDEFCKKISRASIDRFSDPKECEKNAEISRKYWANRDNHDRKSKEVKNYLDDNPKALAKKIKTFREYWDVQDNHDIASLRSIEYWSNQSNRDEMSDRITNSEAAKAEQDRQRGGNDIVKHHYIYDHNNPDQHTVEITRAEHTAHHHWMKRNGLEVPHLNVTEENKDIFKR